MNAGASPIGQAFAIRNCDALFSHISTSMTLDQTTGHVRDVRALAQRQGREINIYTVSSPAAPPRDEAEEYWHHCIVENADWGAVDNILAMRSITPETHGVAEFQRLRNHQANGMGGLPLVGDPDMVASQLGHSRRSG